MRKIVNILTKFLCKTQDSLKLFLVKSLIFYEICSNLLTEGNGSGIFKSLNVER